MSWLLWKGEQWQTTTDEATLDIHLRAPDTGGKRFVWSWNLFHSDPLYHADRDPPRRFLRVGIGDLGFDRDLRQFSGFELRPNPAWQEEHEHFGEYGSLFVPNHTFRRLSRGSARLSGRRPLGRRPIHPPAGQARRLYFSLELDAWVQPRDQYRRTTPETAAEVVRPPIGEPNLRILTRTKIGRATVNLARCGNDPLPLARQYLEECTGCSTFPKGQLTGGAQNFLGRRGRRPGWRCTVNFDGP